jgi:hypothetical protein
MQSMNHEESIKRAAVDRYLLNELTPVERDEFEEHFFDCQECAADVRATAAFLEAARKQLRAGPASKRIAEAVTPWYMVLWTPKLIAPVFAVMLFVIGFENLVIYPRVSREVARLSGPEILPAVSLVGGISRGETTPFVSVEGAQSFLLSFDIPTREQFSSYVCVLIAPSGSTAWTLPVSAQSAMDTVSVRVPAAKLGMGTYTLIVQGYADRDTGKPVDLGRYRFNLKRPD